MSTSGTKRPRPAAEPAAPASGAGKARSSGKDGAKGSKKGGAKGVKYDRAGHAALGDADDEEARLASLVFGSAAQASLFPTAPAATSKRAKAGESDDLSRLLYAADEDGDAAPAGDDEDDAAPVAAARPAGSAFASSLTSAGGGAAWHDDDDDNVAVDVAAVSRLRKLRASEDERVLRGADYEDRLRAQFARRSGATRGSARSASALEGLGAGVEEEDGEDASAAPVVLGGAGDGGWAALPSSSSSSSRAGASRRATSGGAPAAKRPRRAAHDDEDGSDSDSEADGRGDDDGDDSYDDGADHDDVADEEARLLRTTHGVVASGGRGGAGGGVVTGDRVSVTRVRDANRSEPSKAVIQSAEFHPSGSVLFTAGLDRTLRFFGVDGKANPKLASVNFPDMPIASAAWCGDSGDQVLVTGRRPFYYVYDVGAGAAQRVPRVLGREEKSLESAVVQQGWRMPAAAGAAAAGGDYVSAEEAAAAPLIAFLGIDGALVLVSQRTKTWVSTLKLNGSVRAAAFTPSLLSSPGAGGRGSASGHYDILATGNEGEVYRFDLRMMKCALRHVDEGSTGGTALAASPDGRRYAVGATSGVVNVYDAAGVLEDAAASGYGLASGTGASATTSIRGLFASASTPKPLHTSLALTMGVSTLTYSHDGGILAMSSQRIRDSLRLMHGPSGRMFGNWPTNKTPLGYVTTAGFSPNSGYIAVGNDKGRVLLYRLNHYAEA